MRKFIQNKLKEQKGLTLIELLAVIVILAIIAAIAVPAIGNIIENSRYSAVKADAVNILTAANIYYTENPEGYLGTDGKTPTVLTVDILKSEGFIETEGEIPGAATIQENTFAKALGLTTATGAITFSGSKKVKFTGATIKDINTNNKKGSEVNTTEEVIAGPTS